jgi:FkbM family methyltransferase
MKLETNQTCFVTSVVYWEGTSAYEFTDIFQSLFKKAKVFFDVGANIGYYSVMGSVVNPKLSIYSFDPSPGPFHFLSKNLKLNGCAGVKPFQIALSDQSGEFSFHVSYNLKYPYLGQNVLGGSGHLAHVRESPGLFKVIVDCLTLDQFAEKEKIEGLDLIKLDVEEAEHLVLAGAKESLKKFRPIVVFEVFSPEMMELISKEILDEAYLIFKNEGRFLIPFKKGTALVVEEPENFFFVPREKLSWVQEFVR